MRLRPNDLAELLPKQAGILDDAARLVRPGGRLIFATCSVLQEENERQVEAFVQRTPAFRVVPFDQAWTLAGGLGGSPYLSLTPLRHGTDGFFGAVLERVP